MASQQAIGIRSAKETNAQACASAGLAITRFGLAVLVLYMGPSKASNSNAKAQSGEDQKPESTPISTIQPVAATVTDNVSMSEGDAGSRKDTTVGIFVRLCLRGRKFDSLQ